MLFPCFGFVLIKDINADYFDLLVLYLIPNQNLVYHETMRLLSTVSLSHGSRNILTKKLPVNHTMCHILIITGLSVCLRPLLCVTPWTLCVFIFPVWLFTVRSKMSLLLLWAQIQLWGPLKWRWDQGALHFTNTGFWCAKMFQHFIHQGELSVQLCHA